MGMKDSYNKPVASMWSRINALCDLLNLCSTGTITVNTFRTITNKKQTNSMVSAHKANYTDRCLSAKLVPTLADRECRVVSAANPHGR
jgi:hypothetical protein